MAKIITDKINGISISFIERKHTVYVLYNSGIPIYVGITDDIKSRLKTHRLSKDFDSYIVFYEGVDRRECHLVESSLINFINIQFPEACVNLKKISKGYNLIKY